MGYDHYFINETKKHVVGGIKVLHMDYEDGEFLCAYLSRCVGDTIRIVGEGDVLVESAHHPDPAKRNYEYKLIQPWKYKIFKQTVWDKEGFGQTTFDEAEVDRLCDDIYNP